jgi:hypothetical protein
MHLNIYYIHTHIIKGMYVENSQAFWNGGSMIYVCTNIELKDIQHKQTNMSVEYHIYTKIYAQM